MKQPRPSGGRPYTHGDAKQHGAAAERSRGVRPIDAICIWTRSARQGCALPLPPPPSAPVTSVAHHVTPLSTVRSQSTLVHHWHKGTATIMTPKDSTSQTLPRRWAMTSLDANAKVQRISQHTGNGEYCECTFTSQLRLADILIVHLLD